MNAAMPDAGSDNTFAQSLVVRILRHWHGTHADGVEVKHVNADRVRDKLWLWRELTAATLRVAVLTAIVCRLAQFAFPIFTCPASQS